DARGLFPPLGREQAAGLLRYNVADVLLLARVHEAAGGSAESEVLAAHRAGNARGVAFDPDLARALVNLDAGAAAEEAAAAGRLTGGQVGPADLRRVAYLGRWLRGRGVELPDLRAGTVEACLAARPDLDPAAARVLRARLAASRIAAAKLGRGLAALDDDGRLRDLLVYHKAHTGRWAGRL